jgi:long-chain acyl-CoA synthetase
MTYSNKPWLRSYKLGPYKLKESLEPYPEEPVFKALDDASKNYPAQTAILFDGHEIKYRELKSLADRLASGLNNLGIRKGDRVCLFLPNCIEFILSASFAQMKDCNMNSEAPIAGRLYAQKHN